MTMKWSRALLVVVALFPFACPSGSESVKASPAERQTEEYAEQANEAIRALQSGLVEALTAAMKQGGATEAVRVCRDEAQAITARVADEKGVLVGRTSHLLRNPANAPRPWARDIVEQAAGKKTGEVEPQVVDLGDRMGFIKPINTLGLCTNCHGVEMEPEITGALAEAYPEDRAVGFEAGDLRGWMWAEVVKGK
jgi:hypothetical protein